MLTTGNNTFKLLMVKSNPKNLVEEATNFTSSPGTCIALIFTNNASLVDKVYVASPFCITHKPISFDVKYRTFKQYAFKRTVRNYRDVDFQIINNVIWKSSVFNSTNIHEIHDNFFSHHNKILDTHIPRKVITVRHRDKLFTS